MRAGDGAEIGAAGGDDRIGLVGLGDGADRDGRECRLVADLDRRRASGTGARRPAFPPSTTWPEEQSMMSAPASLEHARRRSARRPACCRPRPSRGRKAGPTSAGPRPDRAHGRGTLRADSARGSHDRRRIRRCAGWSAATGSSTADSRGRSGIRANRRPLAAARRVGGDEIVVDAVHVGAGHRARRSGRAADRAAPRPRSAASRPRRAAGRCPPRRPGSRPCGRHGRAGARPWRPTRMDEIDDAASRPPSARRSTGRGSPA